jgi:hypothetical protein
MNINGNFESSYKEIKIETNSFPKLTYLTYDMFSVTVFIPLLENSMDETRALEVKTSDLIDRFVVTGLKSYSLFAKNKDNRSFKESKILNQILKIEDSKREEKENVLELPKEKVQKNLKGKSKGLSKLDQSLIKKTLAIIESNLSFYSVTEKKKQIKAKKKTLTLSEMNRKNGMNQRTKTVAKKGLTKS